MPEDLLRLLLHLLFFAADEGHHVGHDVHRRHAGIARARNGLQRGRDDARDAELPQRPEAHGQHDRRAVRIRDDLPFPAARALLAGDQLQMIRIDFGHQQRHIAIHAVIPANSTPRRGPPGQTPARSRSRPRRPWRRREAAAHCPASLLPPSRPRSLRARWPPRCHFAASRITLSGRALARAEPRQLEQRMTVEKLDEMLAHHAGGAEDADFDFCSLVSLVTA